MASFKVQFAHYSTLSLNTSVLTCYHYINT